MGLEEQKEEREVLDSIFPDEITDISDTAYRISIALDVPGTAQDDEDAEPPTIVLHVSYPAAYPDIAPTLDLSAPPDTVKHPLLDVAADKAQLLESIESTIEESMGMAMIFTLVTTLKDSAESLIQSRLADAQAAKDAEAAKAEEEENRKFHGVAVTRQVFLEWRKRFRAEEAERERKEKEETELDEKKRRVKVDEKKLTGRQLWERGLVGKVDEDEEDVEEVDTGMESLRVED